MKHLKRKTKIAIAVILILIVLSILAYRCGIRIVYAPELDNNWDAISGVASLVDILVSVVSVTASFAAVWAAIQVPQKIAEQQNKIALFEQRLECYNEFQKHVSLASYAKIHKNPDAIVLYFKYIFEIPSDLDLKSYSFDYFEKNLNILRRFPFVFKGVDSSKISEISLLFSSLTTFFIYAEKTSPNIQKDYSEKVLAFKEKYLNVIEESLKLED